MTIYYQICLDCRVFKYYDLQTVTELWHEGHNVRRRFIPFKDGGNKTARRDRRDLAQRLAELDIKKLLTLPNELVN